MPFSGRGVDLKLKISYWIVTHKIFIKKAFLSALFVFDVIFISLILLKWVNFYSDDQVAFEKAMHDLMVYNIDYKSYHQKIAAKNIIISELDAVKADKDSYNLIAKVKNPNENDWLIKEITFHFIYNGKESPKGKSFLFPGEEKFLVVFNVESQQNILMPRLVVDDIKWRRIKKGDQEEFKKKIKKYINFEIKDKKFFRGRDLGLEKEEPLSIIRFKVSNNSEYDYYETGFYIITYSGPKITSVNYFLVNHMISGKTKDIEVRWHYEIPAPSQIVILPEVNLFDEFLIIPKDDYIGLPK